MKTSRRKFIQQSTAAVAGISLLSKINFLPAIESEIVGVQLYSIRTDMGKDPLGTLKKLAEMGYKNVEHANYINRKFYGYSPAEFKKYLMILE